ncbi:MAG: hypothetical protein UT94_C0008G0032 [Candidatus Uhrbacteria bacterium GW2011_GWF2_40_263]|nr:MAG: hypothetical protein UT94_C0008G0032 [Candidatus Uhrbacteria bacterium GW2011_GWF2_40_263]
MQIKKGHFLEEKADVLIIFSPKIIKKQIPHELEEVNLRLNGCIIKD